MSQEIIKQNGHLDVKHLDIRLSMKCVKIFVCLVNFSVKKGFVKSFISHLNDALLNKNSKGVE